MAGRYGTGGGGALAELVGYEVQVRRGGADWETVGRFGPDDQDAAKGQFERVRLDNGVTRVRWTEERVDRRGLFHSRMLGLRTGPAGSETPAPGRADGRPEGRADRRSPAPRPGPRPATTPPARVPPAPTATVRRPIARPAATAGGSDRATDRRPAKPGARRFSITELLGFLFTTVRDQVGPGGTPGQTLEAGEPAGRRGDLTEYPDEVDLPTVDLFTSETVVREFHNLIAALDALDLTEMARANPQYIQGISIFTIGVLMTIEEHIDLFSQRGRTVIQACLSRMVEPAQTVSHFVDSLERYLKDERSATWIRAGSRCFRYYRDADLANLNREFGETFGVYDRMEKTVGGRVKVGIMFTDIVDSTAMTGELGDTLAQAVVDHHDATVESIARKFGGRKVKHLGDGLMLCFGSAQALAGCAVLLVDAMKGFAERPEVPVYRIRCGGHFGEAISKADDFFGTTVQLAARVAGSADPGEARLCAGIIDPDKPAMGRFENCGVATLKGFDQPMALARYR